MTGKTVTRAEFDALNKKVNQLEKSSGKKRVKRKPSEFNNFVGSEIKKIKARDKTLSHTDAFSAAVKAWNKKKGK